MSIKAALSASSCQLAQQNGDSSKLHLRESFLPEMSCHSHSIKISVENWETESGYLQGILVKIDTHFLGKIPAGTSDLFGLGASLMQRNKDGSSCLHCDDHTDEISIHFSPLCCFLITINDSRSNLNLKKTL